MRCARVRARCGAVERFPPGRRPAALPDGSLPPRVRVVFVSVLLDLVDLDDLLSPLPFLEIRPVLLPPASSYSALTAETPMPARAAISSQRFSSLSRAALMALAVSEISSQTPASTCAWQNAIIDSWLTPTSRWSAAAACPASGFFLKNATRDFWLYPAMGAPSFV